MSIGAGAGMVDGVPGGVNEAVSDGVNGGVSGERRTEASADMPSVDISTIWVDTVKRGPMVRQVRGLGRLVRPEGSTSLVAQVTLPSVMTADVKPGENAAIATRKGPLANGHVSSISPSTSGDTRTWISPSVPCPKELAQASKWTALLTSKRSTAFSTSDAPYTAPRTPVFPYSRS